MVYFSIGFLLAALIEAVVFFVVEKKRAADPSRGSGKLFVNRETGEVYAEFDKLDDVEVMELVVKRI